MIYGIIAILYSLPLFVVGVVLLSLAEIQTELGQSRRILAAILETHLAMFEKS